MTVARTAEKACKKDAYKCKYCGTMLVSSGIHAHYATAGTTVGPAVRLIRTGATLPA